MTPRPRARRGPDRRAIAAGWLGYRARAARAAAAARGCIRCPVYHGLYVALWAALPALLFLAVWAPFQSRLVDQAVLASPEAQALPAFEMQRDRSCPKRARSPAARSRQGFNPESPRSPRFRERAPLCADRRRGRDAARAWPGGLRLRRIAPHFRARTGVERW
jgi:phosphate transport system permease protein